MQIWSKCPRYKDEKERFTNVVMKVVGHNGHVSSLLPWFDGDCKHSGEESSFRNCPSQPVLDNHEMQAVGGGIVAAVDVEENGLEKRANGERINDSDRLNNGNSLRPSSLCSDFETNVSATSIEIASSSVTCYCRTNKSCDGSAKVFNNGITFENLMAYYNPCTNPSCLKPSDRNNYVGPVDIPKSLPYVLRDHLKFFKDSINVMKESYMFGSETYFAGGKVLPPWLNFIYQHTLLDREAVEILIKKTLFLPAVVESLDKEAVYNIVLPVYRVILGYCNATFRNYEFECSQKEMENKQKLDKKKSKRKKLDISKSSSSENSREDTNIHERFSYPLYQVQVDAVNSKVGVRKKKLLYLLRKQESGLNLSVEAQDLLAKNTRRISEITANKSLNLSGNMNVSYDDANKGVDDAYLNHSVRVSEFDSNCNTNLSHVMSTPRISNERTKPMNNGSNYSLLSPNVNAVDSDLHEETILSDAGSDVFIESDSDDPDGQDTVSINNHIETDLVINDVIFSDNNREQDSDRNQYISNSDFNQNASHTDFISREPVEQCSQIYIESNNTYPQSTFSDDNEDSYDEVHNRTKDYRNESEQFFDERSGNLKDQFTDSYINESLLDLPDDAFDLESKKRNCVNSLNRNNSDSQSSITQQNDWLGPKYKIDVEHKSIKLNKDEKPFCVVNDDIENFSFPDNLPKLFIEKCPTWSVGMKEFSVLIHRKKTLLLIILRHGFSEYILQKFMYHLNHIKRTSAKRIEKLSKSNFKVELKQEMVGKIEEELYGLMRSDLEHICSRYLSEDISNTIYDEDTRMVSVFGKKFGSTSGDEFPIFNMNGNRLNDDELGFDEVLSNNAAFKSGDNNKELIPYEKRPLRLYFRQSFLRTIQCTKVEKQEGLETIHLEALWNLTAKKRKALLCEHLKLDTFVLSNYESLPKELQLVLIVVHYWAQSSGDMSLRLVYAIILTLMIFYHVDPCIGTVRDENEIIDILNGLMKTKKSESISAKPSVQNLIRIRNDLDPYACAFAALNLEKYHRLDFDASNSVDSDVVHVASQFQACYSAIDILNSLMGSPFYLPSIHMVFNSIFFYRIHGDLTASKSPLRSVSDLLGGSSQLYELFLCYKSFIMTNVVQLHSFAAEEAESILDLKISKADLNDSTRSREKPENLIDVEEQEILSRNIDDKFASKRSCNNSKIVENTIPHASFILESDVPQVLNDKSNLDCIPQTANENISKLSKSKSARSNKKKLQKEKKILEEKKINEDIDKFVEEFNGMEINSKVKKNKKLKK